MWRMDILPPVHSWYHDRQCFQTVKYKPRLLKTEILTFLSTRRRAYIGFLFILQKKCSCLIYVSHTKWNISAKPMQIITNYYKLRLSICRVHIGISKALLSGSRWANQPSEIPIFIEYFSNANVAHRPMNCFVKRSSRCIMM